MDTKRSLVEKIQRMLEGIYPSSTDSLFTFRYVLSHVNDCIATMAKRSALENSNLEVVTYASDEFTVKYSAVPVSKDVSGEYYSVLPQMPIGLPKGRGLVRITGNKNYKSVSFKPVSTKDIDQVLSLPEIHNKVFYYLADGQLRFISCKTLFPPSIDIVMVSSGTNDLDANLNISADANAEIVNMVFTSLSRHSATDLTNDGVPLNSNGTR